VPQSGMKQISSVWCCGVGEVACGEAAPAVYVRARARMFTVKEGAVNMIEEQSELAIFKWKGLKSADARFPGGKGM
jgi:hypothetical protein